MMALTRAFKDTVQARAQSDASFRDALFQEAIEMMLLGDMDTGKAILRDYINATVGFEILAEFTKKNPKSLMRMLGPKGNPQAKSLFDIIAFLQKREGFHFKAHLARG
jgi:DNA-binding phage protein